jgi:hypothetical protein
MSGSPNWSLFFRFFHQNPLYASPLTHTRYMLQCTTVSTIRKTEMWYDVFVKVLCLETQNVEK